MKLDELQELWNSSVNQPTPGQRAEIVARFSASLRRSRRRELCWLVWTFFLLTVLTGFVGWLIFGTNKVKLSTEWAAIPLLLIPWIFACLFLRRFFRHSTPRQHDVTISDSVLAAFAANKSERFKLKAVGLMYLIALPVLALCMWQLHAAGKVSSRELISMIAFLGGALTLSGGAVLAKYWFKLVPTGQKLKALLSQFEQVTE